MGVGTSGAWPWFGGGAAGGWPSVGGGAAGGWPFTGPAGAGPVAVASAPGPNNSVSASRHVGPSPNRSLYIIATRISRGYDDAASLAPGEAYTGSTYNRPPSATGSVNR